MFPNGSMRARFDSLQSDRAEHSFGCVELQRPAITSAISTGSPRRFCGVPATKPAICSGVFPIGERRGVYRARRHGVHRDRARLERLGENIRKELLRCLGRGIKRRRLGCAVE